MDGNLLGALQLLFVEHVKSAMLAGNSLFRERELVALQKQPGRESGGQVGQRGDGVCCENQVCV